MKWHAGKEEERMIKYEFTAAAGVAFGLVAASGWYNPAQIALATIGLGFIGAHMVECIKDITGKTNR